MFIARRVLEVTRRLAPAICSFTSELSYEGRLTPLPGLEQQALAGVPGFEGSGLRTGGWPRFGPGVELAERYELFRRAG